MNTKVKSYLIMTVGIIGIGLISLINFSPVRAEEDPLVIPTDKKEELKSIFAGTTIGILPLEKPHLVSPIVSWLDDVGLDVKRLSNEEVVAALDPKEYPVLVYAGGELYRSTFSQPLDVDNALVDYLGRGGLLFVAPSRLIPFLYNEKGEAVYAATKFGIPPLRGGSPPSGVELTFRANSKVIGDFPELPLPTSGDCRWSFTSPTGVASEDEYVPFISLYDADGKWYGDGAIYVKHVASAPVGGQVVYLWFRLMDRPSAGEFLYRVFKFVGGRLGKLDVLTLTASCWNTP